MKITGEKLRGETYLLRINLSKVMHSVRTEMRHERDDDEDWSNIENEQDQ